jgi:hypothetical protein
LALIILALLFPSFFTIVNRDSGVFLYYGQRLLEGDVLYRDLWDHKPPAIHLVNAFGLLIAHGSMYGVIFLEFLCLFSASVISVFSLRRHFRRFPAYYATFFWLLSLGALLEGGNLTEEYAVICLFGGLAIATSSTDHTLSNRQAVGIGFLSGISFLLRPNLIGTFAAIVIAVILIRLIDKNWTAMLRETGLIAFGFSIPSLSCLVVLNYAGALPSFWDAVFRYNLQYSSTSQADRLSCFIELLRTVQWMPICLVAWATAVIWLARAERSRPGPYWIFMIAAIDLPIELALACVSGRPYSHYFMPVLVPCSVFVAGFAALIERAGPAIRDVFDGRRNGHAAWASGRVFLVVLMVINSVVAGAYWLKGYVDVFGGGEEWSRRSLISAAVEYVEEHTSEGDSILVWGAELSVYFNSGRRSASRFSYQYPVFTSGYGDKEMVEELLRDIKENRPVIIIDTMNAVVGPIDPNDREIWRTRKGGAEKVYGEGPDSLGEVLSYMMELYTRTEEIGPWVAYRTRQGTTSY